MSVHGQIGLTLHCVGCAVEKAGFHLFAGTVAVSHSYVHIVDLGEPVEIGGLQIRTADLLHGDVQGVHTIPHVIASEIPKVAASLTAEERAFIDLCRSPNFSIQELAARLQKKKDECALLEA